jgi:hypothetical protein
MKIFKHTGEGHYIGSCIVVIAKDIYQASEIIKKELADNGLAKEPLNIVSHDIVEGSIIVSINGDY